MCHLRNDPGYHDDVGTSAYVIAVTDFTTIVLIHLFAARPSKADPAQLTDSHCRVGRL